MNKGIVFVLALIILIGALSCSANPIKPVSPETSALASMAGSPLTSSPSPIITSDKFILKRVIWKSDSLYLFGTSNTADGSRLNTLLYKNNQPVPWWPVLLPAFVEDGKWAVNVKVLQYNIPYPFPDFESGYSFRISDPLNPEIGATFDLPFPGPEFTPIFDLKESQWKLVALNDKPLVPDSNITASFDVQNTEAIWGNAGVNFYGSKYETDAPDKILFLEISQTSMGGPDYLLQQEASYLNGLYNAPFSKS